MKIRHSIESLPGGKLVQEGVADLEAGHLSVNACLASIARPRLVANRYLQSSPKHKIAEPERELYHLLCAQPGDAYSRYNSLLGELTSFENALDRMTSEF